MIRFVGLLAMVSIAYVIGASTGASTTYVSSKGTYERMRANDDGLAADVGSIVRDGAGGHRVRHRERRGQGGRRGHV